MVDDFLIRALAAGIGVALVAGPIGCFVVWRRMAYFGATLAHSALLGIALGLLFEFGMVAGIVVVCVVVATLVAVLERLRRLAADTLLGILAHGALACGLIAIAFADNVRVDLMGYLFGDILAVDGRDIAAVYAGGVAALGGSPSQGIFSVTGEGTSAFTTTMDATSSLTGPGTAMTATLGNDAPSNLTAGSATINVSSSLAVGANQTAGAYSGTFAITVNY